MLSVRRGSVQAMASKRPAVPPSQKVAERLAAILAYHGVKPAQLAREIGVTPSAISQWLSASVALTGKNALRIAHVLDEDVEFVMGRVDKGRKGLGLAMASVEAVLGGERMRQLEVRAAEAPEQFRALVDEFLSNGESQPLDAVVEFEKV